MDIETRVKLLEAGYNKDEIEAMESLTKIIKKETDEAKEANEKSEDAKEKSDYAGEVNYKEMFEKLTVSVDGLSKTVKALQENNQKNATIPEDENVPKSADEVIKGFIENM